MVTDSGLIQMRSHRLFRRKVVNVCSCYPEAAFLFGSTACAGASILNGGEVFCVGRMAEINHAIWSNRVSETL